VRIQNQKNQAGLFKTDCLVLEMFKVDIQVHKMKK
jgi:hypothetical protein